MAAPKIVYKRGPYVDVTMRNAGTVIAAGDAVVVTTNGVQPIQSAGDEVFGIAQDDISASGGTGRVRMSCGMVVQGTAASGTDLAFASEVEINTASNFVVQAGATPCGRVVDTNPSSGGTCYVFLYGYRED